MKWKLKEQPIAYSERVRSAYLWVPKCLKREWRWLERAEWIEFYGPSYGWIALRWAPPNG